MVLKVHVSGVIKVWISTILRGGGGREGGERADRCFVVLVDTFDLVVL